MAPCPNDEAPLIDWKGDLSQEQQKTFFKSLLGTGSAEDWVQPKPRLSRLGL